MRAAIARWVTPCKFGVLYPGSGFAKSDYFNPRWNSNYSTKLIQNMGRILHPNTPIAILRENPGFFLMNSCRLQAQKSSERGFANPGKKNPTTFTTKSSYLVVEFVSHLRLGRGGPSRAPAEVFLDERSVRAVFKEARAPRHGRLDDLVSDHQQDIPRHGGVQARRPEVRSLVLLGNGTQFSDRSPMGLIPDSDRVFLTICS